MKHKVRLTVIDKKCFPELQEQYCANKEAGLRFLTAQSSGMPSAGISIRVCRVGQS